MDYTGRIICSLIFYSFGSGFSARFGRSSSPEDVEVESRRGVAAAGDVRERDFVKNSAVFSQSGMWLYVVSHIHTCLSLSSPDISRL